MLNFVTLKNFKSFQSLECMPFKPITILCGTNSCGKSSILQSILLFKQTIESQNPNQVVLLNGRFVHLGTLENVLYKHDISKCTTIEYSFTLTKSELEQASSAKYAPIDYILWEILSLREKSEEYETVRIRVSVSLKPGERKSRKAYISPIEVDNLQFGADIGVNNGNWLKRVKISLERLDAEDNFKIVWENVPSRFDSEHASNGEATANISFANMLPISVQMGLTDNEAENKIYIIIRHFLRDLIGEIFSRFTYLGPLREEPARRYIYEDEVVEIGNKGENAPYIYLTQQDRFVEEHFYYNKDNDGFKRVSKLKLRDAVSNWLSLMGIYDFKPDLNNDIVQLSLNASSVDNTSVNIADVGFGVSQIFPIVLEGLRMPKGNTLLLEQPEIHLHPNLQMNLSDYFIALAKSNKKVVVETHSDHIVNRLVRRIVEDETGEMSNLIGIYFVKSTEQGARYEEISIDPQRGIVNWPEDFFDQTAREQQKIIKAGLRKRQSVLAKEIQRD